MTALTSVPAKTRDKKQGAVLIHLAHRCAPSALKKMRLETKKLTWSPTKLTWSPTNESYRDLPTQDNTRWGFDSLLPRLSWALELGPQLLMKMLGVAEKLDNVCKCSASLKSWTTSVNADCDTNSGAVAGIIKHTERRKT